MKNLQKKKKKNKEVYIVIAKSELISRAIADEIVSSLPHVEAEKVMVRNVIKIKRRG